MNKTKDAKLIKALVKVLKSKEVPEGIKAEVRVKLESIIQVL